MDTPAVKPLQIAGVGAINDFVAS